MPYQNRIDALNLHQIHKRAWNVLKPCQIHINVLSLHRIHIHTFYLCSPVLDNIEERGK